MRFVSHGPSIPGELLAARDEGQVIFFCGSGVSLARSGLPDFYGLARAVIEKLGASHTSRARAVIEASLRVGHIDGVGSLVPADRVFSLLEQEFSVEEVRRAVAASLRPTKDDLSAHQMLLDLSRGTDGVARLVTTNFDPLFEAADPGLARHGPPDLPDPARSNRFSGIVHLHGRIGDDYADPLDDEFVLSSADFGRAYLSDGWATRFIRSLLARYQLVFVGYTADDPPVQYLLEALGRPGLAPNRIYAFQAGEDDQARALWSHKGVDAIAYDAANHHKALWDTLSAWAQRARAPEAWRSAVLEDAKAGPTGLAPHVRGQVAHVASTTVGAKQIARLGAALPAEWLCVFDPHSRYATVGQEGYEPDAPIVDPFELWGLDSDIPPPAHKRDDRSTRREVPADAWSAFHLTRRDRTELDPGAAPHFYGGSAAQVGLLPQRLRSLGEWVVSVAHEPATMWWAAEKIGLHPAISGKIVGALEATPGTSSSEYREGWRLLVSQSERISSEHATFPFYRLDETIKVDGWSNDRARELAALRRPRLRISRALGSWRPPSAPGKLHHLLNFDLDYPDADVLREIPDNFLEVYERALSATIDAACALINMVRFGYYSLGPFTQPEPDPNGNDAIGDDLTALFRDWIAVLDRLAALKPTIVAAELGNWLRRSEPPFVRATIWAAGKDVMAPAEAGRILTELDQENFWDRDHQRDLLHTLAKRWSELPIETRTAIGQRLLDGPAPSDDDVPQEHLERAAWYSLERIQWLLDRGCAFEFDADREIARLKAIQPKWTAASAHAADESNEATTGMVTFDTDPTPLLDIPLGEVLARARSVSGRHVDMFHEARPFAGLVEQRPARALAALRRATFNDEQWAWRSFLETDNRKNDSTRLSRTIGASLLALEGGELAQIVRPATRWFEAAYDKLSGTLDGLVDRLWEALISAMRSYPALSGSGVLVTGAKDHDWVLEAINSPAGRLADLAVHKSTSTDAGGDIAPIWLERLTALLALPGDVGLHALVLAMNNVNYLYARAPGWSDAHLLATRLADESRDAFWSGLFRAKGLTPSLFAILGPELPALAAERRSGRGWNTALAAFLLWAWSGTEVRASGNAISDASLREALLTGPEELRLQLLSTSQRWMQTPDSTWDERALDLIEHVWPRQQAARSQPVANAVARYILAGGALFPRLVEAGRDLIVPVGRDLMWLMDASRAEKLAAEFPDALLNFLIAVLPENAEFWPYRTEKVIEALGNGDYAHDSRLQDLRRRLSAR
ncbi:hypothetical protein EJC47_18430 [Sphingomonas sp. TF3]|uniref:SIR2 family protein n=1 Tax=Sphingomonas sp. TF3 TaxID=2495580 RepID=UPI000F88C544|nr:SIR2 family protein [Sphingomonas sp. TF3]RUN75050.1 hypothetical protein EJC47_18430 [Sphingomonas sp. TF3]